MHTRSAVNTILGYYYQFDYSIYKLLNLRDNSDSIVIEGIEDIDVNTLDEEIAIQCKYYSKTKYNNSVIARPIRLMLKHFKDVKSGRKKSINYYLYGYFKEGSEKLQIPLSIDSLKKNFLEYTEQKKTDGKKIIIHHKYYEELGLNNNDLSEFINKLVININAINYKKQIQKIIESLINEFNCTNFSAENYYYNNALKIIKNLATQQNVSKRKITRGNFIKLIDNKKLLFNEWYVQLKGKKKVLLEIRNEYFAQQNISPFERLFLIEVDNSKYNRAELKELIIIISNKWTKISNRQPDPFCPYLYVHNLSFEELTEIKKELRDEGIKFIDGVSFQGANFSVEEMIQTANYKNEIKIKIINQLDYINIITSSIKNKTKEVYQFYISKPFYDTNDKSIKKVDIQIECINDVKEII